jgi:putative nucleotidyltransferase with HDIG domain
LEEKQYSSFSLHGIHPDKELPGDLYIYINGRFLKYKNAGDEISTEKYDFFIYKKIGFVFCESADLEKFKSWTEELDNEDRDEIIDRVGLQNEVLVDMTRGVKDEMLTFITSDITDENVEKLVDKTKNFATEVLKRKSTTQILAKLQSSGDTLADHSQNVANLSMFLALNIGYGQQLILEKVYLGALLHDYGKTKLDPKVIESPGTKAWKSAMKKHPGLGKTALLADTSFDSEILQMVEQHHERFDGKGFPKGLKGSRTYELSKIVQIANYFDNISTKTDGDVANKQKTALEALQNADDGRFDPKILEKCIRALQTVV